MKTIWPVLCLICLPSLIFAQPPAQERLEDTGVVADSQTDGDLLKNFQNQMLNEYIEYINGLSAAERSEFLMQGGADWAGSLALGGAAPSNGPGAPGYLVPSPTLTSTEILQARISELEAEVSGLQEALADVLEFLGELASQIEGQ